MGQRRGAGLGWEGRDGHRGQHHQPVQSIQPPTYEEKRRTIFVGDVPESLGGDEGLAFFLNVAGGLRRWTRVMDAENKPLDWGFAEYADADSLYAATEVLMDLQVPKRQEKKTNGVEVKEEGKENGDEEDTKNDGDEKPEKDKVLVGRLQRCIQRMVSLTLTLGHCRL